MEFSAWNEPIDMHAEIPANDKWLFDEPFRITTSLTDLQNWLQGSKLDDRTVAGIPARVIVKTRVVTKSPWVIV
jgi:hypothetical protein